MDVNNDTYVDREEFKTVISVRFTSWSGMLINGLLDFIATKEGHISLDDWLKVLNSDF